MEWILSVLVRVLQRSGTRTRSILASLTQAGESFEYENENEYEYEYDCKQVPLYVSVIMKSCTKFLRACHIFTFNTLNFFNIRHQLIPGDQGPDIGDMLPDVLHPTLLAIDKHHRTDHL